MAKQHRRDVYLELYSHWPPRTLDAGDQRETWIAEAQGQVQSTRAYRPLRFDFERNMPGSGPSSYGYRYEQAWIERANRGRGAE